MQTRTHVVTLNKRQLFPLVGVQVAVSLSTRSKDEQTGERAGASASYRVVLNDGSHREVHEENSATKTPAVTPTRAAVGLSADGKARRAMGHRPVGSLHHCAVVQLSCVFSNEKHVSELLRYQILRDSDSESSPANFTSAVNQLTALACARNDQ
eukprot:1377049-Pleurochrysis_carterae.AAC.2